MENEYLTTADLAHRLRIDPRTVYRYIKLYALPNYRVGGRHRFLWSEVEEWIQRQSNGLPQKGDADDRR